MTLAATYASLPKNRVPCVPTNRISDPPLDAVDVLTDVEVA